MISTEAATAIIRKMRGDELREGKRVCTCECAGLNDQPDKFADESVRLGNWTVISEQLNRAVVYTWDV